MECRSAVIEQLERVVKDVHGWSPLDQLFALFTLAFSTRHLRGDLVEIGSWCGQSTIALGLAAKLLGDARLHAIDLFPEKGDWYQNPDGSYSMRVTIDGVTYASYDEQTVWAEPFRRDIAPLYAEHNSIWDILNANIRAHDLIGTVIAHRGTSSVLGSILGNGGKIRLAFIDGHHSYSAVSADIRNVEAHLVEGSWICFDDAFTTYEGVNAAINDLVIASPRYALGQQLTRKLFVAQRV
jgi:hypothetical protein